MHTGKVLYMCNEQHNCTSAFSSNHGGRFKRCYQILNLTHSRKTGHFHLNRMRNELTLVHHRVDMIQEQVIMGIVV